jgi:hypothetical protein
MPTAVVSPFHLIYELIADLWTGISDAHPHIPPSTMVERDASTEHDTHIYSHPWSRSGCFDAEQIISIQFGNTCNTQDMDEYAMTSHWTPNELFK